MTLNVLHLLSPTAVIPAPCLKGAAAGDFIEAGLGKQQQGAAGGFLEPEFDKRGRLLRIVCFWVHGVRVPGEGKQPLDFHCLYRSEERRVGKECRSVAVPAAAER